MNISIRKQLIVTFFGLVAVMFLANFLVNTFFLEDFYYIRKQEDLMLAYQKLNDNITDTGILEDDKVQEFEDICNANNISFIVTDEDYQKVLWSERKKQFDSFYTMTDFTKLMTARLVGYRVGLDQADSNSIYEQTEKYTIQKKFDSVVGIDFLEMWGTLDKGFYFFMRINAENIRDSVLISNEFVKYICLFGAFLSGIFVWFVSKRLTKPLNELTELSKRMADLDFDAKYTSGGNNEVGQLGEHFNQMSEKLEKAYSQLLTANNELQKDIERKEQIDDMRKEFLSNVSHELKTPIALIQGYAEGLQECINDDAESREFYCDVIMDEASKMNGLVQKLLTLNHLEFGNEQIIMERFDIADLIKNKIQSVSILAQQKGAQITYRGDGSLSAWGDEFKVEEVFTNYLSNALNHVAGECRIEITAEELGDKVRVSVFNTGEQIPEEDLALIWDKFYKVDKARTREYGGSGIGLSIVKAIMESFHQQYGVENLEDGVSFWFELRSGSADGTEEKAPDELKYTEDSAKQNVWEGKQGENE